MENNLNVKACLAVFNHVLNQGSCEENIYHYQGFKAWSDFDGYTCYLGYGKVTVSLMFHGPYHLDYADEADLALFIKKVARFSVD